MPTPVALTTGEFDVFDGIALADQDTRLPVLYATNRVPLSTADARVYSIFASDELRLGVASLRIGDDSLDWEGLRALSMRATNERRPLLVSESVEELATLDSNAADGTLSKTAEE